MGISSYQLKSYIQSHLSGLLGNIDNLEIDKVEDAGDGFRVQGTFGKPWGDNYSFTMELDSTGGMKSYEKQVLE